MTEVIAPPYKKKCFTCNQLKLGTEFGKRTGSQDGLLGSCKICINAQKTRHRNRRRAKTNAPSTKIYKIKGTERQNAEANRNAILSLVHSHRNEFDDLVHKELLRMKYMQGEDDKQSVWIPTAAL